MPDSSTPAAVGADPLQALVSSKDFERATMPWLDQLTANVCDWVDARKPRPRDPARLKVQLIQWLTQGYVVLEKAIEDELIDAYFADVRQLLDNYRDFELRIDSDVTGVVPIRTLDPKYVEDLKHDRNSIHLRFNDLHNYSIAAKKMSLHPRIVEFVETLFRDQIVVLQSLSFFTGSEQELHADYAFVPACVPSQLCATWTALEDIHPDSGPLKYVPGSHILPKFEWGDGIFRTPASTRTSAQFHQYLIDQAARHGLPEVQFCPRKGDVLVWHGALTHGGSPVRDRARTRKAYVTHYSQASTHHYDFRDPGRRAERIQVNGGFLHKSPIDPAHEDVLRHGADL